MVCWCVYCQAIVFVFLYIVFPTMTKTDDDDNYCLSFQDVMNVSWNLESHISDRQESPKQRKNLISEWILSKNLWSVKIHHLWRWPAPLMIPIKSSLITLKKVNIPQSKSNYSVLDWLVTLNWLFGSLSLCVSPVNDW